MSTLIKTPVGYKTEEFFEQIYTSMEKSGFDLISQVSISTEDGLEYHVPCVFAKVTTMVFAFPGKALYMLFNYYEAKYSDSEDLSGYWSIEVSYKLSSPAGWNEYNQEEEDTTWESYPFKLKLGGNLRSCWSIRSGSVEHTEHGEYSLDTEPNRESNELMLNQWIPFLLDKLPYLSTNPYVIDYGLWYPHYVFNNSQKLFWSRFNINKLERYTSGK